MEDPEELDDSQWAEHRRYSKQRADELEQAIPDFKLSRRADNLPDWGGVCPWQALGTYQGNPCYLRYRHNTAAMTVWSDEPWGTELFAATIPDYNGDITDIHAGWIETGDEQKLVSDLIAELAPISNENPSSQTQLQNAVNAMVAIMKENEARESNPSS